MMQLWRVDAKRPAACAGGRKLAGESGAAPSIDAQLLHFARFGTASLRVSVSQCQFLLCQCAGLPEMCPDSAASQRCPRPRQHKCGPTLLRPPLEQPNSRLCEGRGARDDLTPMPVCVLPCSRCVCAGPLSAHSDRLAAHRKFIRRSRRRPSALPHLHPRVCFGQPSGDDCEWKPSPRSMAAS